MKTLRKSALVAVMALALVLLTFGIGLAQDTTVNVTLGMSEFKFDPAELDLQAGATVTFNVSNTGQFPHNVTFVAPDGTETNLLAENVAAGQSATGSFTFNTAGEWRMYCPVGQHEERGMVGIVRVAAAAGGQSGATPSAAAATPATLPTTGAGEASVALAASMLALLLVSSGVLLRRTSQPE